MMPLGGKRLVRSVLVIFALASQGVDPKPATGALLEDCLLGSGVAFDNDTIFWTDKTGASARTLVTTKPVDTSSLQSAIFCARDLGLSAYPVSGRHSYQPPSISGQVLVDVSEMCTREAITFDQTSSTLRIPAGCPQGVLLSALPDNTIFPVGNCPTVGLGGLLLGGGMTDASRYLGLACDSIEGLTMVTSSGEVINATRETHPDVLYMACGSGVVPKGGIVTSFTLRLSPLPESARAEVSRISVFVSSNATANTLTQLQTMLASEDERYWKIGGGGVVGVPELRDMDIGLVLQLLYLGPGPDGVALLEESGVAGPDSYVSVDTFDTYKEAMVASMVNEGIGVNMTNACDVFGCFSGLFDATNHTNIDRLVAMLDDPSSPLLDKHSDLWSTRDFSYPIPGFMISWLPTEVWNDLAEVSFTPARTGGTPMCGRNYILLAHFSGGRVRERNASSSAFPWRNDTMLVTWLNGASPTEQEACAAEAARYDAVLKQWDISLDRAYLNYRGSAEWDDKVTYVVV